MNFSTKLRALSMLASVLLCTLLGAAPINIPMGANAYITQNVRGARITDAGVVKWTDASTVISSWFRVNQIGKLNLALRAKSADGNSTINITVDGKLYPLLLNSKEWTVYPVADDIPINQAGHIRIDIQGVEKESAEFAEVSDWILDGSALAIAPNYVKDFSYHFGRRGPSVHLKYTLPQEDVEYFYNEVTVPEGEDVIGSYYMANGFGEGYFGMQANSETERRILFSVWSPFDTQDPNLIPEEDKIKKLRQGEGVHIGEFGNEGSGGQSYLIYPWKAGETYKFLMQIHPDGKGKTIYTAYFYAMDENRWRLIASFSRPKTDTWYTSPYSFLENFIPNQGYIMRKVLFGNQWALTRKGKWIEVTDATFTYDATARAQKRTDYRGGAEGGELFFLQNCGFFDHNTLLNTKASRNKTVKKPSIDLKKLRTIPSVDR